MEYDLALRLTIATLTVIGSAFGSYVATRVALAIVQTKVGALERDMELLNASRIEHSILLGQHSVRLDRLEG